MIIWGLKLELASSAKEQLRMAELSKLLKCSTDFLMGLTDEIRPAPVQEEPVEAPEEPARRIRWEDRGRTPPEGRLILTYQLTNDGPAYRPALWDGSTFRSPQRSKRADRPAIYPLAGASCPRKRGDPPGGPAGAGGGTAGDLRLDARRSFPRGARGGSCRF